MSLAIVSRYKLLDYEHNVEYLWEKNDFVQCKRGQIIFWQVREFIF